jgi:hypothetical protein
MPLPLEFNLRILQAWLNVETSVILQQINSRASQLSRDKKSDNAFLCQNLGKAVFSLLDASSS